MPRPGIHIHLQQFVPREEPDGIHSATWKQVTPDPPLQTTPR